MKAPRLDTEAGLQAKQTLGEFILSQRVGLTLKGSDGYGGYKAEVYLCTQSGQKENVNDQMIERGWGWQPDD